MKYRGELLLGATKIMRIGISRQLMERLQNMRNNAAGDGETNCRFSENRKYDQIPLYSHAQASCAVKTLDSSPGKRTWSVQIVTRLSVPRWANQIAAIYLSEISTKNKFIAVWCRVGGSSALWQPKRDDKQARKGKLSFCFYSCAIFPSANSEISFAYV